MPTARRPVRRPAARVPLRRNRMAADLGEALDMAVVYAEEAERYASDEGREQTAFRIGEAVFALQDAAMVMHEEGGEEEED